LSYSLFLVIFICIPLVLCWVAIRRTLRWRHYGLIAVVAVIAVIYTTPWDNFLVARGVWHYDPSLVWNITLGYVPLEEYLFFILQTCLTGLFVYLVWRWLYPQDMDQ